MNRLYHECPLGQLLLKDFSGDVNIGTDQSGRTWGMGVAGHRFPILFCPFCGAALEKESQVSLCGAAGPASKACDREQGHDGPHRAGWTGTVAIPGFKAVSPDPSPGAQLDGKVTR